MLEAQERVRRLAPIAIGAAAIGVAAVVHAGRAPGTWLPAAALAALAAGLIAQAVAGARDGWRGAIGGMVAGSWFAACPVVRSGVDRASIAAAVMAVVMVACGRMVTGARGGDGRRNPEPAALVAAVAAVALVAIDPRAWAVAMIAAALLARRGARRMAIAPAVCGAIGAVIDGMMIAGRDVAWASAPARVTRDAWSSEVVDRIGAVAVIAAAIGVMGLVRERKDRWSAALVSGALVTAVPLGLPVAMPAVVAMAIAIGAAVAAMVERVQRPVHMALAAGALAAVMCVPFAFA